MTLKRKLRYGMIGGGRGAFIGAVHRMAAQLDGKDPKQAKELEEAHKQLVNALAIVRVRGGKFRVH